MLSLYPFPPSRVLSELHANNQDNLAVQFFKRSEISRRLESNFGVKLQEMQRFVCRASTRHKQWQGSARPVAKLERDASFLPLAGLQICSALNRRAQLSPFQRHFLSKTVANFVEPVLSVARSFPNITKSRLCCLVTESSLLFGTIIPKHGVTSGVHPNAVPCKHFVCVMGNSALIIRPLLPSTHSGCLIQIFTVGSRSLSILIETDS